MVRLSLRARAAPEKLVALADRAPVAHASRVRPTRSTPTPERARRDEPGPKPADSEIDVFGLTHRGKVRTENQDHFLICQLTKQISIYFTSLPDVEKLQLEGERLAFLAMIADGVGGGFAGEEASRLALEAVTRYVAGSIDIYYRADPADDREFARALSQAALRCHEDLVRASAGRGRGKMATTLTLAIGVWPRVYVVQLGDSRYYLLREGELVQVSRDQTLAEELVDQGILSRNAAAATPWAHVLSSAIGAAEARPVVTRIEQDRSYVHLLCSDGLTKHLTDEHIAERLRSMTSARQVCEDLVEDALAGGGTDNVTVIVARVRP
jgi:protein phosphatase